MLSTNYQETRQTMLNIHQMNIQFKQSKY